MKIQSLFLILVLILQSITACKKDVSSSEALEGKWGRSNEWDNGYIFHEELNFRGDGTVEIIGSVIDLKVNVTKGYLNRQTGTYTLKGDSVIYTNLKVYYTKSSSYKKMEELGYQHTSVRYSQGVAFNSRKNELTLTYGPCNDVGNCIGPQKYFRK